jgi:hypothetical protein
MGKGSTALSLGFLILVDPDHSAARSGETAVHAGRGEAPGRLARRRHGDQPAIAALLLDLGQHPVERLLDAGAAEANARAQLMRGSGPDEDLAEASGAYRGRAVVGIGAGTDQRRIADPAPALGGQPAGRRRGRNMAVTIERDRTDRPIFDVGVKCPAAMRE